MAVCPTNTVLTVRMRQKYICSQKSETFQLNQLFCWKATHCQRNCISPFDGDNFERHKALYGMPPPMVRALLRGFSSLLSESRQGWQLNFLVLRTHGNPGEKVVLVENVLKRKFVNFVGVVTSRDGVLLLLFTLLQFRFLRRQSAHLFWPWQRKQMVSPRISNP